MIDIRRPAPSEKYADAADGLRVIFIFIIGWYHIWQQSWLQPTLRTPDFTLDLYPLVRTGYIWVDGMLLLSGFLTFLPYARAMLDGGPLPDWKGFYRRRAARILPSYFFCVALLFFADALPGHAYGSTRELLWDVIPHLTFTHVFFSYSYFSTHLNVVLWTLAVEVQFYLIFPLLARAFVKKPALTWCAMCAASFAYRRWVELCVDSNAIYINQLIAFLDIYALGFLAARIYVSLCRDIKPSPATQLLATGLCAALLALIWQLVIRQYYVSDYEALRVMQMRNRFPLGALTAMLLLCLSWSLDGVRWLLSNRAARFLSGVSFQFYIWHQYLAVLLRRLNIPYSALEKPNQAGETLWQWQYTFAAFGAALIAAIAATYLVEKPCARLILGRRGRHEKR